MKRYLQFLRSATGVLIAANVAIFVLINVRVGSANAVRVDYLEAFGANVSHLVKQGEYFRWISSAFLHIGIAHLAFNMLALHGLGRLVEVILGTDLMITLYAISALGGGVLSYLMHPDGVSAGASGAIFGLGGVLFVLGYVAQERVPAHLHRQVGRDVAPFLFYNLVYGMSTRGIDNSAHIGGLIAGAASCWLLVGVFGLRRPTPLGFDRLGRALAIVSVLAMAGSIGMAASKAPLSLARMAEHDEAIDFHNGVIVEYVGDSQKECRAMEESFNALRNVRLPTDAEQIGVLTTLRRAVSGLSLKRRWLRAELDKRGPHLVSSHTRKLVTDLRGCLSPLSPLSRELDQTPDSELRSRLCAASPDERLLARCREANDSVLKSLVAIDRWEAYCRTVYPEFKIR